MGEVAFANSNRVDSHSKMLICSHTFKEFFEPRLMIDVLFCFFTKNIPFDECDSIIFNIKENIFSFCYMLSIVGWQPHNSNEKVNSFSNRIKIQNNFNSILNRKPFKLSISHYNNNINLSTKGQNAPTPQINLNK